MKALSSLLLEFRIRYYETALKHLQQRDPTHADLPGIVQRINALVAERPPIETRPRSRCSQVRGMCAGDPNCEDHECAGRTWGLHQRDGGHEVHGPLSFPIEHS